MPATDTYWRSLKKMHVVFAVSAIGLLAVTLGMMWADHNDEWRAYQDTFDQIEEIRLEQQVQAEKTESYEERLNELNEKLEAAQAKYEEDKGEIEAKIEDLTYRLDLKERATRAQRAFRDKARADYDLAIRDERTEAARRLKEKFDAEQAKVDKLEQQVQDLNGQLSQLQEQKESLRDEVIKIEEEIAATKLEVERLEAAKQRIAPDDWFASAKREFMQWPIIDGFNSPREVKQVWLPDLKITLGMARTARFDRCKTCHLGIDRVETGNLPSFPHDESRVPADHPEIDTVKEWVTEKSYPHPYSTHPNPDLYLSATSPHPTQEFGCTICHDGQGSATDFHNVQHTPNDPHQHEHWADKYHYHPNHYWEYPMKPERFRESNCLKCHHSVVELENSPEFGNSAPKLVEGFHTIQEYGCFGCHEIHGQEGAESIGPDLRLEPNHYAVALSIADASKELLDSPETKDANGAGSRLKQIRDLAHQVAEAPEGSDHERKSLQQLVLADKNLEKPLFDTRIHGLADELKDISNPGQYRKVGPSLRHVDKKTTQGWLEYWTSEPKRFRPSTRMPQFFHLTNQEDELAEVYQPVQIAAIANYLLSKSQTLDLMSPEEGYEPDAERGQQLFAERGCLACHTHNDFPGVESDFGPNLDKVYAKVKPGEEGFNWVYSWIRDPHRYHKRTKMPNLFIEPEVPKGGEEKIDPAADIAAYLLQEREENQASYEEYNVDQFDVVLTQAGEDQAAVAQMIQDVRGLNEEEVDRLLNTLPQVIQGRMSRADAERLKARFEQVGAEADIKSHLDRLVALYLSQALTINQMEDLGETKLYPYKAEQVKGDEIELVYEGDGAPSDQEWRQMKLNYIGRRTISQYGCYGCHDIPGFEATKPIGVALQDWGRKDTSRLAFEHIEEFLHHHNSPGSETALTEQVDEAIKRARAEEFQSEEEREDALSKAFYYDSILHHGRPGFLWQKLRQPRSYDYKKTETKRYDERLRMPRFPFNPDQVEAVATFVLGLTAEPPGEKYLYKPQGAMHARYEGEALLHKYNCTSCHMVELPEVEFSIQPRKSREDAIYWLQENREDLASGKLGYEFQGTESGQDDESDYQSFPPAYRQIHRKAKQEAGIGLVELAAQAGKAAGENDAAFRDYVDRWFVEHPEVLSATYADAITDPGGRDLGMTRDQIVTWFLENRDLLLAGEIQNYPPDIQIINDLCKFFGMEMDAVGIANLANVNLEGMSAEESAKAFQENLTAWFDNHPEVLLTTVPDASKGKLPEGVHSLFGLKPPKSGVTNQTSETGDAVLRFHGMGTLYEGEYSYNLWDTLDVDGRILLPTSKLLFTPEQVVSLDQGRGGDFAEWLVQRLSGGAFDQISKARQSAPPPLVLEGLKVQTPWLYNFLKNPDRIRNETVLRMPRFNMSNTEARALANYFAAVDDADYPYQDIPQKEPGYAARQNQEYQSRFAEDAEENADYLSRSWKLLGKFKACRQCHSIAGDELQVTDPKQLTHGPDLDTRVADRFRPEFLDAWLHSPQWILPYSAMIGPTGDPSEGYFGEDPSLQVQALRDAMLNYNQLLQTDGKIEPPPPAETPPGTPAGTGTQ